MLTKKTKATINNYLAKNWVLWLIATVIFVGFSWLYMGNSINSCSTTTIAGLGSDTTGGMAWQQAASGNDFTWDFTNKSNYPFGEELYKPQYVTSFAFLSAYKLLAMLTTPICGLNLIVLLGYLSSALTMFGLVKWLLRRVDIALFAGYAAAFVPFHFLKAQSHINYVYGSVFIALLWAFLWLVSKPSYKRAVVFGAVSAIGFYFDGYFILISGLLMAGLIGSYLFTQIIKVLLKSRNWREQIRELLRRLKYIIVSGIVLGLLLTPIAVVYKSSEGEIKQSLSAVRSNIKSESLLYGLRPIELILPAANNPLLPDSYPQYRNQQQHGSNYSESTLYVGYTILILAAIGVVVVVSKKRRLSRLQDINYAELVFIAVVTLLVCLAFSLPAHGYIFGMEVPTPTKLLIKLTANWRVLSRIFLALHPLFVLLASFGLYWLTKNRSKTIRTVIVAVCGILLFLEYLPYPLSQTGDLYKDAPPIYKQLSADNSVSVVAEYPLADFSRTPEVFTFQPVHQKTLVNALDGTISLGPFKASIAGLNDPQTLGTLKSLRVDEVITHGFRSDNSWLDLIFSDETYDASGKHVLAGSSYAYKLSEQINNRNSVLLVRKGYESLLVDNQQISHRFVTNKATFGLHHFSEPSASYRASFLASSVCDNPARIVVSQDGNQLWGGQVTRQPAIIRIDTANKDFDIQTNDCSIDITHMEVRDATN